MENKGNFLAFCTVSTDFSTETSVFTAQARRFCAVSTCFNSKKQCGAKFSTYKNTGSSPLDCRRFRLVRELLAERLQTVDFLGFLLGNNAVAFDDDLADERQKLLVGIGETVVQLAHVADAVLEIFVE